MTIKCRECDTSNPSDSKYCKECATSLPSPEDIKVTETMEAAQEELTTGSTFAEKYQIIDELTTRIKRNFKLSDVQIESDIDRHIGEVTTRSTEAYKYYHEGIKYDIKGDYPMNKLTTLDNLK